MPGRLAIPAVINAKTNIEIVIAPLREGIMKSVAFAVYEKLPSRTQSMGQAIVQKSTLFCLMNSLIVLLKVAVIWPN